MASDTILGLNWLTETNPKINWATCSVTWTPIIDYKMVLLHAIKLVHESESSRVTRGKPVKLESNRSESFGSKSPTDLSLAGHNHG